MSRPCATKHNNSDIQKTKAIARYKAVRHLPDDRAALALGITVGSVMAYRRVNPELRYSRRVKVPQIGDGSQNAPTPSGGLPTRSYAFEAYGGRVNKVSVRDDKGVRG